MQYQASYPSPVGPLLLIAREHQLTGLWFDAARFQKYYKQKTPVICDELPLFSDVKHWLDQYFAGNAPDPRQLPLDPQGTHFQQLVWKLLLEISYGKSCSYGELAKKAALILGKESMSAQAVGNAVGRNPISIIIPCHRVLGADSSLTGFGGGLKRKQYLLDLEQITYR